MSAMRLNVAQISEIGIMVNKNNGDIIFTEGEPGHEMYVILSGKVEISLQLEGKSIMLAQLEEGNFFGEMSLLEGMPRSGTAKAVANTQLVLLRQESFRQLMMSDSELAWRVMNGLSTRLRNQNLEFVQRLGKDLLDVADQLNLSAQGISGTIKQIAASAEEIETNERHLAKNITEIKDISKQISESLTFIGRVAQQTKIFGLNASIEAARSGEFGKGFGVIAEEIRKLSEVSRHNADKMSTLTLQINAKMEQITQASFTSTKKSQEQSSATHDMVSSVEEVAGMANKLAKIANSL
jgi:methyl-accepting chemotaxis protein